MQIADMFNDRVLPDDINVMLLALLGNTETIRMWWTTPNFNFGLLKPIEADHEKVLAYVKQAWH